MLNIKRKLQHTLNFVGFGGMLLLIAYSSVLFLLIDCSSGWVQPEVYRWKSYIVNNIPFDLPSIMAEGFNWRVFEIAERLTRPLSSSFEIADTYFRGLVWNYFPPMPSLSLTFIFSLILGPIFFYKFCLNLGIRKNIAKTALAYMLVHQGYLSLIFMYFRPAKAMINFLLIFILYLCSRINIHIMKNESIPKLKIGAIYSLIFTAFFFDETALIIIVAILILFPKLVFGCYKRFLLGAATLCAAGLSYLYLLPTIAGFLGFGSPNLLKYEVLSQQSNPIWALKGVKNLLFMNILTNTRLALIESFQLFNPFQYQSLAQILLSIFLFTSVIILIVFFCFALFRKKYYFFYKPLIYQTMFCLFFALAINNFLLNISSSYEGRVWGLYWYGTYISIFFSFFIAGALEEIAKQSAQISKLSLFGYVLQINILKAASWSFVSLCIILSILNFKYINCATHTLH
ncbi:MAG: hypothetical protein WCJ74_03520, partial [bacterium]